MKILQGNALDRLREISEGVSQHAKILQLKRCSRCKETKVSTDFSFDRSNADGLDARCKACRAFHNKQYYQRHRQRTIIRNKERRLLHKDEINAYKKELYKLNRQLLRARNNGYDAREHIVPTFRARQIVNIAHQRSKIKGVPFGITWKDITFPLLCPVLGIPINYGVNNGNVHDSSPSLDRRIPELGYVKGNVQIISAKANRIKTNATPEELRKVADYFWMMS